MPRNRQQCQARSALTSPTHVRFPLRLIHRSIRVLDSRLEREALEGHEHVTDLLPCERLAVNEHRGEAAVAVGIPT
jgi:hypothetical protein